MHCQLIIVSPCFRYGWFEPILKQQSSVASLPSVHSAEKTIVDRPSDPPSSQQEQMVNLSEFPANFARPSVESTPEQTVSVSMQCHIFLGTMMPFVPET
jgi:hypothetical protein